MCAVSAQIDSGYRESNSTADRALTILGLFDDGHLSISAVQVAEELRVARSTAYRYLQSLVGQGFLEEAPGGGFRLGLRILQLARLARRGYGLSDAALPVMRELADRYHQTVLLTRRVGESIVCIERSESDEQAVRLSYERGTVLPINAGASALALLAWLPEDEVRETLGSSPLRRFTSNTLVDVDAIVARLNEIRAQGYAMTFGEVDAGIMGIAVPLVTDDHRVIAALSFVGLQDRISEERRPQLVEALLSAAQQVSTILHLSD